MTPKSDDAERDGSALTRIPDPDAIRDEMARNAAKNRILRSLWRIATRAKSLRSPTEVRQGVSDEK